MPGIQEIQKAVCMHYGITMTSMLCQRRDRHIVRPRQVAMYLCKELTLASFTQIGRMFHRDHTTVMHACKVIEREIADDPDVAAGVVSLRAELEFAPAAKVGVSYLRIPVSWGGEGLVL